MLFSLANLSTTALCWGILAIIVCLGISLYLWKKRLQGKAGSYFGIALLTPLAMFLVWFIYAQANAALIITEQKLNLRVPFYSQKIDISDIKCVRRHIEGDDPLVEAFKINALVLPQYSLGWLEDPNYGMALVAINNIEYVEICTYHGYGIMISVDKPQQLVDYLNQKLKKET